jgi:beta-xylosidase
VVLGPDGVFHMVWTTGWWDRGFGLAHSRDLVHWTGETYVPVMEAETGALNTWAPEIAYDAASRRYVVFWATTIEGRFPETLASGDPGQGEKRLNHRIYAATTADFADWSPARLFLDPGFNVIDATLFEDGGRFRLFVKDETRTPPAKNLRMLTAESPLGSFGKAGPPITGDYWAEGPTAYRVGGFVYVLFDRYREKRFGAVRTRDFERWEDVSDLVAVPEGARHGTVIRLEVSR